MMRKITLCLLVLVVSLAARAQFSASNFTLISNINPEVGVNNYGDKYSGCWGWYQAAKNREYAIACSKSGTYWVDVTNPVTPTISAFRAGAYTNATWREVKTYSNYCYVVSDDAANNNSFQIFDMQYLPDSVSKVYDSNTLFKRGHALWVDGNKLYVSGVTYSNTSTPSLLNVYSLANPTSPVLLRSLEQDYPFFTSVHDAFARNDTVFASCGYQGLYVFKFTTNNTFQQIGSLSSYPYAGYNHSSALTPNGQTLVFMDEVPGGLPIKIANVSNLSNIQVLATTNQFTATTPHNPFVVNNQYCFTSSYQDGLQLYDISVPASPTLAGFFDTYPQGGGNTGNWGNDDYKGQWGSYPYLPSKVIFALDMENGIFLLRTHLYANPAVAAGFSISPLRCAGLTMTLTNTSQGATNYTWTFSGGSGSTTVANPTVSFASAGVQSITLVARNPSYSMSITQTLAIPSATSITASLNSTNVACATCSTGAISLSVSGGLPPYTYSWAPSGGSGLNVVNLPQGCYTVTITDAAKCVNNASACVLYATGLDELADENDFALYPNPARHETNIRCVGEFSCRLMDVDGRVVLTRQTYLNRAVLKLDRLPAGLYWLEVEKGSQKFRRKLLVE